MTQLASLEAYEASLTHIEASMDTLYLTPLEDGSYMDAGATSHMIS